MLFVSHDEDGRIEQANKVFDYVGYADKLRDAGHRFIQHPSLKVISPSEWFVFHDEVVQRQPMEIAVDRTTIKAGGSESAVFRGIPADGHVRIWALGELLHDLPNFGASELEVTIPAPLSYVVTVHRFPWLDYSQTIQAVA